VISFGKAWIGEADLYRRLSARKNERLRNGRLWREAAVGAPDIHNYQSTNIRC
jgi:hypothetical protein